MIALSYGVNHLVDSLDPSSLAKIEGVETIN